MTPQVSKGAPRAVADLSEGLILATVEIAAPAERVFRALASEEIINWWGSAETYRTTKWTGDVRVGGTWRTESVGTDGPRSPSAASSSKSIRRTSSCRPGARTGTAETLPRSPSAWNRLRAEHA